MEEFFQLRFWIVGLVVMAIAFVLNTVRRLIGESRRMPREEKLELLMHRAAMALRKLGRAKRILRRCSGPGDGVRAVPVPGMVRRLAKAREDAHDAAAHLSAVLRQAANLGCSISVMRNLDRYIEIAKRVNEDCGREVRAPVTPSSGTASPTEQEMASLIQDCTKALREAETLFGEWVQETAESEQELARTVDPVILRSGGVLRNPFKPEDSIEKAQTFSVLRLEETKRDLLRVQECLPAIERAIKALKNPPQQSAAELASIVSGALDSLDVALGDAELPLPPDLAAGESPFDEPTEEEPSGTLQRIYVHLTIVEASLFSARR